MEAKTLYDEYLKDNEFVRIMAEEDLIMDVTENFCRILEEEKLSRANLAEKMGKTRGYISQLLNGNRNITLRVLSDIAFYLGYSAKLVLRKRGVRSEPANLRLIVNMKEQSQDKIVLEGEPEMKACVNFGNSMSRVGM
jgi:transcriptional regulator with XRE-family HTH domain